MYQDLKQKY
jgi:hypothetical protein